MKVIFIILPAIALAATAFAERESPSCGWREVLAHTGLLPEKKSPFGAAGPGHLEEQLGRKLTEQETALLKRGDDGPWKTHADELISFELPDDPLLKVEALTPEERPELRIVGGAVGTTDNSFQRVYRITFSDGVPYGLVLVTQAGWFDDGICFCGPVVLKTYVPADGTLLELSQLPDGNLKKFQALNSTHRAILFEWTHSAITQAAYARIGASLRFVAPSPRGEEEWRELARKHDGAESAAGWLRPGMERDMVKSLMGPPDRVEDGVWFYIQDELDDDGGGWRSIMRIRFENDILGRFDDDWSSFEELEPARGSRNWIRKALRDFEGDPADPFSDSEEDANPPPPEDLALILSEFHRHAPRAEDEEWNFWCGVIADLARGGVKNPEAVELIAERAKETGLPQFQARWVLELYEHAELLDFTHSRIRFLMGDDESAVRHRGEFHNLLAGIERGDPEAEELLREAIRHEDGKLRADAAHFVRKLPRHEARRHLADLLADEDANVRRLATLNIQHLCTTDDEKWLTAYLDTETDANNRKLLEEKIGQLKPAAPADEESGLE